MVRITQEGLFVIANKLIICYIESKQARRLKTLRFKDEEIVLGPTVNAIVIVICGLVGCFLIRGIPARFEEIIKKALALSIVFVGLRGALANEHVLLLIISMVAGAVIGEFLDIHGAMNRLGLWAERRLGMSGSQTGNTRSFAKAFVTTTILYSTGAMAIVGSMQSGLDGNHEILFAKSVIDGVASIVFGASMGIGVVFSAIPVFLYQSAIVLVSAAARDFLTYDVIREMSAVGSLVVAAIGFNLLDIKEIRIANFIPAIFIPLIVLTVQRLLFG